MRQTILIPTLYLIKLELQQVNLHENSEWKTRSYDPVISVWLKPQIASFV